MKSDVPPHWSCSCVSVAEAVRLVAAAPTSVARVARAPFIAVFNGTARRRQFSLHGKSQLSLELIHKADKILTQLSLALWIHTQPKYRVLGETLLKGQR